MKDYTKKVIDKMMNDFCVMAVNGKFTPQVYVVFATNENLSKKDSKLTIFTQNKSQKNIIIHCDEIENAHDVFSFYAIMLFYISRCEYNGTVIEIDCRKASIIDYETPSKI